MSKALVPGLTLLSDPLSSACPVPSNCSASLPNDSPTDGDLGPIWTSVNGGGLGKRGELEGDTPAAVMVEGYQLLVLNDRIKTREERGQCLGLRRLAGEAEAPAVNFRYLHRPV